MKKQHGVSMGYGLALPGGLMLGAGDFLAAKGPLFRAAGVATIGAVQLRARGTGNERSTVLRGWP